MKIKRLWIACGVAGLLLLGGLIWLRRAHDLGLTVFDVALGGFSEAETVRTNTRTAAEAFLRQHQPELIGESSKGSELVLDYSKASEIRSLGYRSSFYYYCWSIFLPYSIQPDSGAGGTVIVQLTDSIPENGHDPKQFRVIRAVCLDGQGKVVKQLENHGK